MSVLKILGARRNYCINAFVEKKYKGRMRKNKTDKITESIAPSVLLANL